MRESIRLMPRPDGSQSILFEKESCDPHNYTMQIDYTALQKRMGLERLSRRLNIQVNDHANHFLGHKKLNHRLLYVIYRIACWILRSPLIYRRGHRNALDVRVRKTELFFDRLPQEFDGFRILHISDLHMDGASELKNVLIRLLKPLEYDLCVLTGDFREGTMGDYDTPAQQTVELCCAVQADTVAVLGNHDAIEMVQILEEGGVRVLLNEHLVLEADGAKIVLLGVDDPHYYQADDVGQALMGSPNDGFKILLAHSPEITHDAVAAGVDLYLCGHTHGGQICFPDKRPLLTASRGPRYCHGGLWKHEGVVGYTSVGAGSSTVPVRFNCPPEIAIHTLRSR